MALRSHFTTCDPSGLSCCSMTMRRLGAGVTLFVAASFLAGCATSTSGTSLAQKIPGLRYGMSVVELMELMGEPPHNKQISMMGREAWHWCAANWRQGDPLDSKEWHVQVFVTSGQVEEIKSWSNWGDSCYIAPIQWVSEPSNS